MRELYLSKKILLDVLSGALRRAAPAKLHELKGTGAASTASSTHSAPSGSSPRPRQGRSPAGSSPTLSTHGSRAAAAHPRTPRTGGDAAAGPSSLSSGHVSAAAAAPAAERSGPPSPESDIHPATSIAIPGHAADLAPRLAQAAGGSPADGRIGSFSFSRSPTLLSPAPAFSANVAEHVANIHPKAGGTPTTKQAAAAPLRPASFSCCWPPQLFSYVKLSLLARRQQHELQQGHLAADHEEGHSTHSTQNRPMREELEEMVAEARVLGACFG